MPRRDNLRPLRRAFRRAADNAKAMEMDDEPFDQHYRSLSSTTLIELATKYPTLSSTRQAKLNSVRASMIVLAAAELKLTEEMSDE